MRSPLEHSHTHRHTLSLSHTHTHSSGVFVAPDLFFAFVTALNLLFLFQKETGRLIVDICKHNIFSVITDKFLKCLLHCKHVHLNRKHCFSQSPVKASQQIFQEEENLFSSLCEIRLAYFLLLLPPLEWGIGRGGGCYFKKKMIHGSPCLTLRNRASHHE